MKQIFLIILLLLTIGCKENLKVQKITGQNIEIDDDLPYVESLNKFIEPYKSSIEGEMNKPLSYTPKSMFKNDTPYNTAIGNMMADAVFEMANPIFYQRNKDSIDGVLLNYGGIRAGIDKGKITTRTAYNIMPFENMVVVAKLNTEQVKQMFNYLSEAKRAHPISNMSLVVDPKWNLLEYKIDDKEIQPDQVYYVATSDYLVNGGDNMSFFQKAEKVYPTDYKLRSLLIDYFQTKDTIQAKPDNRFQMKTK